MQVNFEMKIITKTKPEVFCLKNVKVSTLSSYSFFPAFQGSTPLTAFKLHVEAALFLPVESLSLNKDALLLSFKLKLCLNVEQFSPHPTYE